MNFKASGSATESKTTDTECEVGWKSSDLSSNLMSSEQSESKDKPEIEKQEEREGTELQVNLINY